MRVLIFMSNGARTKAVHVLWIPNKTCPKIFFGWFRYKENLMKTNVFPLKMGKTEKKSEQLAQKNYTVSKSVPIDLKICTLLLDIFPNNSLVADFRFSISNKFYPTSKIFLRLRFFSFAAGCVWLCLNPK